MEILPLIKSPAIKELVVHAPGLQWALITHSEVQIHHLITLDEVLAGVKVT